jgi:hypothetical protein
MKRSIGALGARFYIPSGCDVPVGTGNGNRPVSGLSGQFPVFSDRNLVFNRGEKRDPAVSVRKD